MTHLVAGSIPVGSFREQQRNKPSMELADSILGSIWDYNIHNNQSLLWIITS